MDCQQSYAPNLKALLRSRWSLLLLDGTTTLTHARNSNAQEGGEGPMRFCTPCARQTKARQGGASFVACAWGLDIYWHGPSGIDWSVRIETSGESDACMPRTERHVPIIIAWPHPVRSAGGGASCARPLAMRRSLIDRLTDPFKTFTRRTQTLSSLQPWPTARSGTSASSAWAPVSAAAVELLKVDDEIRHRMHAARPPCVSPGRAGRAWGHRSVDPRAPTTGRPTRPLASPL